MLGISNSKHLEIVVKFLKYPVPEVTPFTLFVDHFNSEYTHRQRRVQFEQTAVHQVRTIVCLCLEREYQSRTLSPFRSRVFVIVCSFTVAVHEDRLRIRPDIRRRVKKCGPNSPRTLQ